MIRKSLSITIVLLILSVNAYSLSLQETTDKAQNNNYIIKKYAYLYESAHSTEISMFKNLLPDISTQYSYTKLNIEPYQVSNGKEMIVNTADQYHWNIIVTQPLFTGFYLLNKYKFARYNEQFSKANLELVTQQIIVKARVAYFNVLYNEKNFQTRKLAEEQFASHLQDAQAFYDKGIIPENDLLQSEAAYANAKEERKKAKADLDNAVAQLNQLINEPIDKNHNIEDVENVKPVQEDIDSFYNMLAGRPDIHAMYAAIAREHAGVGMARSQYYPHLSVVGNYSKSGDNMDMSRNPYQPNILYGVSIIASWDIFDWGKSLNDAEAQKMQEHALKAELSNLETSAKTQILSAYNEVSTTYDNISVAKKALEAAQENFKLTNLRYLNQLANSTDVLDARTLLTQAESNYYGSLYGYCVALSKLELAVGKIGMFDNLIVFK